LARALDGERSKRFVASRELSEAEGVATRTPGCAFVGTTTGLRRENGAIADEPRCWGSRSARLLLRTEKEPPASASCFHAALLTLRVEFDVGGDGGAESSSSCAECASARVGRRCTESRSQVVGAAGSRVCRKAERNSPWTRLLSCDRRDFVQRRWGLGARGRLGKALRLVAMGLHLWYNFVDRV
jgi:hypothetical protein